MRFAIFPLHLSKILRLPRKSDARSYEVLHLSCKIISANLKIWCSKMQPLSGNQRPDLLTSLMNMSFVLRLPRKMHLWSSLQILFTCTTPATVFGNATKPSHFAHFWQGAQSLAPATRKHIWTSKSGPNPGALNILTSTCVSRKSAPTLRCFVHFDFEFCNVHFDFEFCTFWLRAKVLRNVLRATTSCNFSSLIWPAGSAPAALASLLFHPPEPQLIGKT